MPPCSASSRWPSLHGGREAARGELLRYFAEMAGYSSAFLPSQGVRWEALDEHSANATLVDGPVTMLWSG